MDFEFNLLCSVLYYECTHKYININSLIQTFGCFYCTNVMYFKHLKDDNSMIFYINNDHL